MSNIATALIVIDGLIATLQMKSEIGIQVSELQMLKQLILPTPVFKPVVEYVGHPAQLAPIKPGSPPPFTDETPAVQPALRAAPMALFPTMCSLQSVIDLGISQLPITTPNAVTGLLMTYHNTLLDQVQSCKPQ